MQYSPDWSLPFFSSNLIDLVPRSARVVEHETSARSTSSVDVRTVVDRVDEDDVVVVEDLDQHAIVPTTC